jgi:hypothetical protein
MVQVINDANARPNITALTTIWAVRNMPQGDRSLGSSDPKSGVPSGVDALVSEPLTGVWSEAARLDSGPGSVECGVCADAAQRSMPTKQQPTAPRRKTSRKAPSDTLTRLVLLQSTTEVLTSCNKETGERCGSDALQIRNPRASPKPANTPPIYYWRVHCQRGANQRREP